MRHSTRMKNEHLEYMKKSIANALNGVAGPLNKAYVEKIERNIQNYLGDLRNQGLVPTNKSSVYTWVVHSWKMTKHGSVIVRDRSGEYTATFSYSRYAPRRKTRERIRKRVNSKSWLMGTLAVYPVQPTEFITLNITV